MLPLVAIGFLTTTATHARDDFKAYRKQAVKNARTSEGKAYERDLYPAIGADLSKLLKKCTTDFPSPEGESFELVIKIDRWGEPKVMLARPLTDLSQCVARGSWYFSFPLPDARFAKKGLAVLLPITIS